jgi:hypothetical protein
VIANNPGVVTQEVEEVDHRPAFVAEGELGSLIDVTDIDQERVGFSRRQDRFA